MPDSRYNTWLEKLAPFYICAVADQKGRFASMLCRRQVSCQSPQLPSRIVRFSFREEERCSLCTSPPNGWRAQPLVLIDVSQWTPCAWVADSKVHAVTSDTTAQAAERWLSAVLSLEARQRQATNSGRLKAAAFVFKFRNSDYVKLDAQIQNNSIGPK